MVIRLEGIDRDMQPDTVLMSYGMGWVLQDYRGVGLCSHAGAIDGFRVHFTLIPEKRIGIVLLANLQHTRMNQALSNSLVDLLLDLPKKDWNALGVQGSPQGGSRRGRKGARTRGAPQAGCGAVAAVDGLCGRLRKSRLRRRRA